MLGEDGRGRPSSTMASRLVVVAFFVVVVAVAVILGVAVFVVLVVPVAFVHLPALLVMIIVRMIPVGAFVRRTVPVSPDPVVVAAIGGPISFDPGVARARHRSTGFVAKWWRCGSDVDRNLG